MSKAKLGDGCRVAETAEILPPENGQAPARIGSDSILQSGATIYPDVVAGDRLQTGHHSVVREATTVGHDCRVGSQVIIGGRTDVGHRVHIDDGVYLPAETTVGDGVFIGPRAVLTTNQYPAREGGERGGPTLQDGVAVGANATIRSDVTVGEHSVIAAGAVVTEDVPPSTLAVGVPAKHRPLPDSFGPGGDSANRIESDD